MEVSSAVRTSLRTSMIFLSPFMAARLSRGGEHAALAAGGAWIDAAGVDCVIDHLLEDAFASATLAAHSGLFEVPEAGSAVVDGTGDVAVGFSVAEADDHDVPGYPN